MTTREVARAAKTAHHEAEAQRAYAKWMTTTDATGQKSRDRADRHVAAVARRTGRDATVVKAVCWQRAKSQVGRVGK